MEKVFIELGIAIISATVLGIVARAFKQPLILAYILTGFILGPSILGFITGQEIIDLFSTIGIVFLLFIVGMELSLGRIKKVGAKAIVVGIVQLFATVILGYFLGLLLGLGSILSLYVGILLAFSSTVVVIKLLSEKRALNALYGKMVIGILILQDIAALFVLMILSGLGDMSGFSSVLFLDIIVDGILLIAVVYLVSKLLLYRLFKYVAHSSELLFITSVAWCFLVSGLFIEFGFSIEMGAFVAGITMASLPYREEIALRLSSLRDFFLILFFVALGMQIDLVGVSSYIYVLVALVAFVVVIKPLIILVTMGSLGFTKRTSFYSALSLSQVSEFSLIIGGMGLTLGFLDKGFVSLLIVVTVITILTSSYLITFLGNIYNILQKPLVLFEKKNIKSKKQKKLDLSGHVVLFGYHRLGSGLFNSLKKIGKEVVVVDLDPEIIEDLPKEGVKSFYGDAYDVELLDKLNIEKAKMIVVTFPGRKSNLFLIKKIRDMSKRVKIITIAEHRPEALVLYDAGADYVILPRHISAEHVSTMLDQVSDKKQKLKDIKKYHIQSLKD